MSKEETLGLIKDIRNTFDTLGVECGMASRLSMDAWARLLESDDTFQATCLANSMLHKIKALEGLLYSIKTHSIKIKQLNLPLGANE